jgi:hypothetical protein
MRSLSTCKTEHASPAKPISCCLWLHMRGALNSLWLHDVPNAKHPATSLRSCTEARGAVQMSLLTPRYGPAKATRCPGGKKEGGSKASCTAPRAISQGAKSVAREVRSYLRRTRPHHPPRGIPPSSSMGIRPAKAPVLSSASNRTGSIYIYTPPQTAAASQNPQKRCFRLCACACRGGERLSELSASERP